MRDFFRPRRLGHANLYVSDYAEAQQFYYSVAGIHEAYRQPDNMASFITNGNTYHDFGLTDIRSPYAPKGQKPGLFHLAFELENEVELVDGTIAAAPPASRSATPATTTSRTRSICAIPTATWSRSMRT